MIPEEMVDAVDGPDEFDESLDRDDVVVGDEVVDREVEDQRLEDPPPRRRQ